MALTISRDIKDFESAIEKIKVAFGASPVECVVKRPGKAKKTPVYWSKNLGIWFCALKSKPAGTYLLYFGSENTPGRKPLLASGIITLKIDGAQGDVFGELGEIAQDAVGKLWLLLRGKDISSWAGNIAVEYEGKTIDGKLLGCLETSEFADKVATWLHDRRSIAKTVE